MIELNKTTNSKELPSIRLMHGDEFVQEDYHLSLCSVIADGFELRVVPFSIITVYVYTSKNSYTISISEVSYLR